MEREGSPVVWSQPIQNEQLAKLSQDELDNLEHVLNVNIYKLTTFRQLLPKSRRTKSETEQAEEELGNKNKIEKFFGESIESIENKKHQEETNRRKKKNKEKIEAFFGEDLANIEEEMLVPCKLKKQFLTPEVCILIGLSIGFAIGYLYRK